MHSALLIAKREYLERIRSKAFRISTVLMPLLFGLIFGIGAFSASHLSGDTHIVVASNDAQLAAAVRDQLATIKNSPPHVDVQAPATEADLDALAARVEAKQIDGYLWLQVTSGDQQPKVVYATRSSTDPSGESRMQDAVSQALLSSRLRASGLQPDEVSKLLKPIDVQTLQVKNGKVIQSDSMRNFWAAYVMMFLLYFSVMFYGLNSGRSVVEEKTSRIFEVLLSSVKAESLMIGKLLGVGGVALTQLGIWVGLASIYAGSSMAASMGIHGLASVGIQPIRLVFFVIYFILGFLFYSSLSCGLGATMSTEQEMNQFGIVITLPLILSFVMFTYVLTNPSSALSVGLSLFPPCTPLIMCLRMGVQTVPPWQLALSVVLMILAIYLVLWLASRIYRIGILMYGKRPNLPEMMRWMRYS
jgi:ABC-2 type transport system permease protein